MKRCMICLILLTISNVFSQPKPANENTWALQFSIKPKLALGSYLGDLISGMYRFSENNGLRFGLNCDISQSSSRRDVVPSYIQRIASRNDSDITVKQLEVALTTQYVFFYNTIPKMYFYFAIGTTFCYGHSKAEQSVETVDVQAIPNRITLHVKEITLAFATQGNIGFEWFINDQISLMAEYGFILEYSQTELYEEEFLSNVPPGDNMGLNDLFIQNVRFTNDKIRFGITIYF